MRSYVSSVLEGRETVGELVRLAVERHARDLAGGASRGLYFDEDAAARALSFFAFLVHSKGEWAGEALELAGWQRFVVGSLFGWKRADGSRRFRSAYVEVARKNGKSTLGAGLGLYCLIADQEPGAEVYSAATTRDQAKIVFDEAERMVKASAPLSRRVTTFRNNLHIAGTASRFRPLSSDWNTLDGLNIHCAIVDEVHAHPNRELWDVIETSVGARRQPLILAITTAGTEALSVCGTLHDYSRQLLTGALEDDTLFPYVAALDEGDAWNDPSVWVKANPNLGVSVKLESISDQCARAESEPASQNAFRRLRLNQWVGASSRFLDLAEWDACAGELDPRELETLLEGRAGYVGLDLASTIDLAALALVFPPEDSGGKFECLFRIFMPEEAALDPERRRRDRVPYDAWVERGWIHATPGNVIDYAWIRRELEILGDRFSILQVGYDPWNATQFATELEEEAGLSMVPIRQGYASLSNPTKELAKLVRSGGLRHAGHPVLRWMVDNLVTVEDPSGNLKPDRRKSRHKIDGAVALVMALDRALRNEGSADASSIYSSGGFVQL